MRDNRGRFNIMNSRVIESGAKKMVIPGLGVLIPKIRNFGRQRVVNNRQGEGVMNIFPNGAPRLGPYRGVAIVNLVDDIGVEMVSDFENGRPIYGFGDISTGFPEGSRRIVFGLKNIRKQRVFIGGNVPSQVNEKALINQFQIPDPKTTLLSRFADVLPRTKGNRSGLIFFLHTCPPEFSHNRVKFFNKSFGEKNSGRVINRDRGEN